MDPSGKGPDPGPGSQLASLVLLHSDFSAMPSIVAEGRRVINNIQRAAALFLVKNIFSLILALLSILTGWAYPLQPMHLALVSALTIGIPSFFLAMEPNYERVQGHFLRGVLRRAFPGGLTNVITVLICQGLAAAFGLGAQSAAAVSTGILGTVGILVLYQVCKPFDSFRRIIWWAMLIGLVLAFTLLGPLLELQIRDLPTLLLMLTLMLVTPTVFFIVQRVFDLGDRLCARLIQKKD